MDSPHVNRTLRVSTAAVSAVYVAGWLFAALLVIVVAAVELFGDGPAQRGFTIGVPVSVELRDVHVQSIWRGQTEVLRLGRTDVDLEVPIGFAPAWFRAVSYAAYGVGIGLVLLFLRQLRGVFRSARDGAPFDPRNTGRLRWMAILLVAVHMLDVGLGAWQAATVLSTIANSPMPLEPPFALDERIVFAFNESVFVVALILFGLGEIFRRGAVLEDEQSLVV